jgi:hypothetical protein
MPFSLSARLTPERAVGNQALGLRHDPWRPVSGSAGPGVEQESRACPGAAYLRCTVPTLEKEL